MTLHERLAAYLDRVAGAFSALGIGSTERYDEEAITLQRANLRMRVRFENGELLEVNEAIVIQDDRLVHLDYRYHFQDGGTRITFRYDNAPHFPDLPTESAPQAPPTPNDSRNAAHHRGCARTKPRIWRHPASCCRTGRAVTACRRQIDDPRRYTHRPDAAPMAEAGLAQDAQRVSQAYPAHLFSSV